MADRPENLSKTLARSKRNTGGKKTPADIAAIFAHGKVQPQARELEEAVLGALLVEKDAITKVVEILNPMMFYDDRLSKIYSAVLNLYKELKPIDILTITDELRREGKLEEVGGAYYIVQLSNKVSSAAHLEYHARVVNEKYIQRELIRVCGYLTERAFEDNSDVLKLLDEAEQEIFKIADENLRKKEDKLSTIITGLLNDLEKNKDKEEDLTGVRSGFAWLDKLTSGWQKSDLIVVAARPGMGKTAFVLSLARNAAVDAKVPVALFSLEMSAKQLTGRLISAETEIPMEKLKRPKDIQGHEWQQLLDKVAPISNAPIFIDDTAAISILDLKTKCRRLKANAGIGLIIIDYLQLMRGDSDNRNGNREQEISSISRALKAIAKELDVPVIALSQLSRAPEQRSKNDKRPMLSDLRESGAIEQDADIVLFLYRPDYYGLEPELPTEWPYSFDVKEVAEINIEKHRNGATGRVYARFVSALSKFVDPGAPASSNSPVGNIAKNGFSTKIVGSRMNEMTDEDDNADITSSDYFDDLPPVRPPGPLPGGKSDLNDPNVPFGDDVDDWL